MKSGWRYLNRLRKNFPPNTSGEGRFWGGSGDFRFRDLIQSAKIFVPNTSGGGKQPAPWALFGFQASDRCAENFAPNTSGGVQSLAVYGFRQKKWQPHGRLQHACHRWSGSAAGLFCDLRAAHGLSTRHSKGRSMQDDRYVYSSVYCDMRCDFFNGFPKICLHYAH